jgi:hypothetical protein
MIDTNNGIDKMTDRKIETVKFNGVDTVAGLVDLANAISKVLPDISFKQHNMNTWGVVKELFPDGVCDSFYAFHSTDLNNHIGLIEVANYYNNTETHRAKYGITSINIEDGRNTYGGEGAFKYSVHAKNIVRVAKKAFKPFTFDQIADRAKKKFTNEVESISHTMSWEVRQKTCDGYQHLIEDMENLFHLDYKPKNAKFKQMIEYVVANKEKIDKYLKYDPPYYFVLVKDNEVQYRLNSAKGESPSVVPSKDDLPEDIKGKLFVLDIGDKQSFVEDIGLKENDGAYWIIA